MSKRRLLLPEHETATRLEATAPRVNAWVSANAGSGKTSILRDRVIRLLLDGVPPDRILCLTFTKAAAAEMQGRIFAELARWVALDDAGLAATIDRLVGVEPAPSTKKAIRMARARQLFAEAVETPGGLKLQTIHAFAERILHLFPIEAGVPVDFVVLDENEALDFRAIARRSALKEAVTKPDSAIGRALNTIASAVSYDGFARVIDEAIAALTVLRNERPERSSSVSPEAIALQDQRYQDVFGVPMGTSAHDLDCAVLSSVFDPRIAAEIVAVMLEHGRNKTTPEAAKRLEAYAQAKTPQAQVEGLLSFMLTATSPRKIRDKLIEAAIEKAFPEIKAHLDQAKIAVAEYLEQRQALRACMRSRALWYFADQVLDRYARAKASRNSLDFDDLIARLRHMLNAGQSAWVMMKLDAAIDHILVDEAQDTTPAMWDIIKALADDFFSGEGQARFTRSLFVVGDEKQSIFSFQGAKPHVFEEVRQHFSERVAYTRQEGDPPDRISRPVELKHSFRSSADILAAVDRVFVHKDRASGLSASGMEIRHIAAHDGFPGLVELWPVEPAPPKLEQDPDAPVDAPPPKHPAIRSAERIAQTIGQWLSHGERHLSDGTLVQPSDILILAQHRNVFFNAVLRELKRRNIPVAGADRLKVQEEIAIHDLLAVARASLLPADDLALAAALKSPLFGLDDAMLETLCAGRVEDVRSALRAMAMESPVLAAIHHRLDDLHMRARMTTPFVFFSSLLIEPCPAHPGVSGRQAILTRLGTDAADAMDAFLSDALAFEQSNPASLLAFVDMQQRRRSTIKRDQDTGAGQVRVMTIHASKGLEARIVFLGDTLLTPRKQKEKQAFLMPSPGGECLVWAGGKADETPDMGEMRARERHALLEEYRRLLYVGLTRAADRLYVTAFERGKAKTPADPTSKKTPETKPDLDPMETPWHQLVADGFEGASEVQKISTEQGDILRWASPGPATLAPVDDRSQQASERPGLPHWLLTPLAATKRPVPPLRPSRRAAYGDADPITADIKPDARLHGILIHRLFEHLPGLAAQERQHFGRILIAQEMPQLADIHVQAMLDNVLPFISSPLGQRLLGPQSRAEVAIAGNVVLADGQSSPVSGRIDRVLVQDDSIEILDFKTGNPRAAVEDENILRQMALYRALLLQIYPKKAIIAHVFWTQSMVLDTVSEAAMEASFRRITQV